MGNFNEWKQRGGTHFLSKPPIKTSPAKPGDGSCLGLVQLHPTTPPVFFFCRAWKHMSVPPPTPVPPIKKADLRRLPAVILYGTEESSELWAPMRRACFPCADFPSFYSREVQTPQRTMWLQVWFQQGNSPADSNQLIGVVTDSRLVKLCVLDWLERQSGGTRPFVE